MPERGRQALWSGTITFGLVSIPVELHPALRSEAGVAFRMLAPDGTPLRREYCCPKHERRLEDDEIVRGYELDGGGFVVLEDEELEALAPEASRDIALERFVDADQLSPLYFERPYLLLPSSEQTKPYGLLAQVLERTDRIGLARLVMRGRVRPIAIFGAGGLLHVQALRFTEQLRGPDEAGVPDPEQVEVDDDEVEELREQIRARSREDFDPTELVDERAAAIEARAREKLEAGEDVVEPPADADDRTSEVIDIMELLTRRLKRPA